MRVTTKKILKTSVNVDSIIKLDFVLSDIDIESDKGITCSFSSFLRVEDSMIPPSAKVTGMYVNNSLAQQIVSIHDKNSNYT